jgi:HEAT repeat protein
MSSAELVAMLAHANGWHRNTAARLLHLRQDKAAVAPLAALSKESPSALGRTMALRVLTGCSALSDDVLAATLADREPIVRAQAVRSASIAFAGKMLPAAVVPAFVKTADDASAAVRYELAWSLDVFPRRRRRKR